MAGMGKRMRPHTLTVPKPLIPIVGKPIVQRLAEDLATAAGEKIDEIAYIIGDFGKEVENQLQEIAKSLGAKASIYYQAEPLGTAHAVLCAAPSLTGRVIVAFADTLFRASFTIDDQAESTIWVQEVDDPSSFGVVKLNQEGFILDFIEKPKTPVSNLAIIGVYYFKDGDNLRKELQFLLDKNQKVNGEYQLTDALENMKNKGLRFTVGRVDEWFDCGNKEATLHTVRRILDLTPPDELIFPSAKVINSVIIPPVFLGIDVLVENSVLGPYLSVGKNTHITNSILRDSIIQRNTTVDSISLQHSIVGNHVDLQGSYSELNIGDYTSLVK